MEAVNQQGELLSYGSILREFLPEKPMPFDSKDVPNVAVTLALSGIAGAAVIQSYHDEKAKEPSGEE